MKKIFAIILVFLLVCTASDVYAFDKSKGASADWNSKPSPHPYTGNYMTDVTSSTDNTVSKKTNTDSKSGTKKANKQQSDLEALYDEFQKFWFVKNSDDLQDRFEEFLKTKHIDPDDIDDYDEFMEVWVDNYDDDLDFDDLESYIWDSNDSASYSDEFDEYEILLDDDIDELYDDYLDDYIDEEYYEDYGEYFDEVYYD